MAGIAVFYEGAPGSAAGGFITRVYAPLGTRTNWVAMAAGIERAQAAYARRPARGIAAAACGALALPDRYRIDVGFGEPSADKSDTKDTSDTKGTSDTKDTSDDDGAASGDDEEASYREPQMYIPVRHADPISLATAAACAAYRAAGEAVPKPAGVPSRRISASGDDYGRDYHSKFDEENRDFTWWAPTSGGCHMLVSVPEHLGDAIPVLTDTYCPNDTGAAGEVAHRRRVTRAFAHRAYNVICCNYRGGGVLGWSPDIKFVHLEPAALQGVLAQAGVEQVTADPGDYHILVVTFPLFAEQVAAALPMLLAPLRAIVHDYQNMDSIECYEKRHPRRSQYDRDDTEEMLPE